MYPLVNFYQFSCIPLCRYAGSPELFPPDRAFFRKMLHIGQFFFNLQQTVRAQFICRLLNRAVFTSLCIASVHTPEIGDFLANVAKALQNIIHVLIIRHSANFSRISQLQGQFLVIRAIP